MSTSFSAPVNMADSMENVSSWTVSGSKEGTEVSKDSKDLLKCGIQNIVQYSAANDPFPAFFPTNIHFNPYYLPCLQVWPAREAKPRFGGTLVHSAHHCKTHLLPAVFYLAG